MFGIIFLVILIVVELLAFEIANNSTRIDFVTINLFLLIIIPIFFFFFTIFFIFISNKIKRKKRKNKQTND